MKTKIFISQKSLLVKKMDTDELLEYFKKHKGVWLAPSDLPPSKNPNSNRKRGTRLLKIHKKWGILLRKVEKRNGHRVNLFKWKD